MKQERLSHAMFGGFIATLLMTVLLYLAPLAHFPKMDIAAMLGSLFGHGVPATMTGLWWAGMVWHFVNGSIIFPMVYSFAVHGWLPGEDWLRGMMWGLLLWIGMEVLFMPMTGSGVFSDHLTSRMARILGCLILNAIYGVTLGAIAGEQGEHAHDVAHPA